MKTFIMPIVLLIPLLFSGCNDLVIVKRQIDKITPDRGDYSITAKYDSIVTYPDGGGIFIFKFTPDVSYSGLVTVKLSTDKRIHATINKSILSPVDSVFDVIIKPDKNIETGVYNLKLMFLHAGVEKAYNMKIIITDWDDNYESAMQHLDRFSVWVKSYQPQYNGIFSEPAYFYATYPKILIVEHYSFISDKYEVRLCFHVMIPPHDWSMLCIRKRTQFEPEMAFRLDTDGNITSIPVSEYPVMYGY